MDRTRSLRLTGAAITLSASLALTGCGMNVQTLQEYTPAHGVNAQTGDIKVRNLLIVANDAGQGVLSASLVTPTKDELVSISGTALTPDGEPAGPLLFTASPVQLPANQLVVLTDTQPPITVTSADMKPGLTAQVDLGFSSGGQTQLIVPVVSASDPTYSSVQVGG